MFLFPVPVAKVVIGGTSGPSGELESVHSVDSGHLAEDFLSGVGPVVRIDVVVPVGVNGHFVAPVVSCGVVAVVRTQKVDSRFEHLVDERFFGRIGFGGAVAYFVDVSTVQIRRNFHDAFLRIDGDVDGGVCCGCETCCQNHSSSSENVTR